MSLLKQIQQDIMDPNQPMGPLFLKLRFLASRLGSDVLEDWVKLESEGYPNDAEVPSYRRIGVSYTGTFSGPFGSGINNAPIPGYIIEKYAGENWTRYSMRESISAIETLSGKANDGHGALHIQAANLILLLQGNIYEGMACNGVSGTISVGALVQIQHTVRARALELTIQLEKAVPEALTIEVSQAPKPAGQLDGGEVTKIANQVINGNVTHIVNSGPGASFTFNISAGSQSDLKQSLIAAGFPEVDAAEFGDIVAGEEPAEGPGAFGENAKVWLEKNIPKALNGTWKMGLSVASTLLTEAAKQYYGLS